MAWPRVRFPRSGGQWVGERDGVGFTGETDLGPVKFLVTSEALAQVLSSALGPIDSEMALEVFLEFEADIQRVAQREFVKRRSGEPPILLTAAGVKF